jgi:hypothetical protein
LFPKQQVDVRKRARETHETSFFGAKIKISAIGDVFGASVQNAIPKLLLFPSDGYVPEAHSIAGDEIGKSSTRVMNMRIVCLLM